MQIAELTKREQKRLQAYSNEYLGKLYAQHKRNKVIGNFRNQLEANVPEGEMKCRCQEQ